MKSYATGVLIASRSTDQPTAGLHTLEVNSIRVVGRALEIIDAEELRVAGTIRSDRHQSFLTGR
jgi:hypothetical protein